MFGFPKSDLPIDAVLGITYRCNLRCSKCNLWQDGSHRGLDLELIEKLPTSLRDINISGGEPFLHPQLVQIVERCLKRCPKARVIISTGGWLMEDELDKLNAISRYHERVGLAISIDGMAVEHDLERGRPGSFQLALETLKRVRLMGIDDIRLAFTFTADNIETYQEVCQLAEEQGVDLSTALVHNSEHYFVPTDAKKKMDIERLAQALDARIAKQVSSLNPKTLARAYFLGGLEHFASTHTRPLNCRAARDFFYLDPNGVVYACNMHDAPLGDLHESSFDAIWHGVEADKARDVAESCNDCWMVCSARTAMKRAKTKIALWIIRAKLGDYSIK